MLVHLEALASSPFEYIKGVLWRLRGYRVRSRGRIASLTARSPHAYALWIARDEGKAIERVRETCPPPTVRVVVVVEGCFTSADAAKTLASLDPVDAARVLAFSEAAVVEAFAGGSAVDLWICPVKAGDQLAPGALSIYAAAIAGAPRACLIYADDDLIDKGERSNPHFKPDWNPELFKHHDFLSHACVIRTTPQALRKAAHRGSVGALVDDALNRGAPPMHVPLVLHHRVRRPDAVIPPKMSAIPADEYPKVSVIVPTRNQHSLLRTCMEGLGRTHYPLIEPVLIDNDSDEAETLAYIAQLEAKGVKVLRMPGPFNYSALNNAAVSLCSGEVLCFLNNDVEMIDDNWLSTLVNHAVRRENGAVGPRLLYPDGTIQHAGVVTGIGGGAAHAHRLQHKEEEGYFHRARLPQQVSAVTAACLVVERDKFLAVGGFDEVHFPVAFNDVDLCLKLNAAGWQAFYEPRATLIHHESKSRGRDTTPDKRRRFAGELAALKTKWRTDELCDPYHHPCLSRYTEQFLLSV